MRSGKYLWAPVALLCGVCGAWAQQTAPVAKDSAPWHLMKVAKVDNARGSSQMVAPGDGSAKYLHVELHFNIPPDAKKLHKFRVTNRRGEEVGELWGWNDSRSSVVFEGKWTSLTGLYLDGLGHREPLFPVALPPRAWAAGAPAEPASPEVPQRPAAADEKQLPRSGSASKTDEVVDDRTDRGVIPGEASRVIVGDGDRERTVIREGTSNRVIVHEEAPDRVILRDGGRTIHVDRDGATTRVRTGDDTAVAGGGPASARAPGAGSAAGTGAGKARSRTVGAGAKSGSGDGAGSGTGSGSGTGGPGAAGSGPGGPGIGSGGLGGVGGSYGPLAGGTVQAVVPPPQVPASFALYISTGEETGPGKVYQVDDTGRVLGVVHLPSTATGIALHRADGLILALPRDGGRIMRADDTGQVTALLAKDKTLPHPLDVAVGGDFDTVLVADNIADVLATTTSGGGKPSIYRRFEGQQWVAQEMSIAVTRDKHVIFGTDGDKGIYRYLSDEYSAASKPVLPAPGGVAADPKSLRWAATQEPNRIYVFDGEELVKTLRLPPNKSIYRQGLLSFAPAGCLCVAARNSDEPAGEPCLFLYNIEKDEIRSLFPWTREKMVDFVVGPRMPWNRKSPNQYKSMY